MSKLLKLIRISRKLLAKDLQRNNFLNSTLTVIETQLGALLYKTENGERKAEKSSLLYPFSAFDQDN